MAAIANNRGTTNLLDPQSPPLQPSLRPTNSFPIAATKARGGLAARRVKPNFNLRDIDPSLSSQNPIGGGAAGAGLGAGRPMVDTAASRKPPMGTPFSNFSKIVYALSYSPLFACSLRSSSDPTGKLNFKGTVLHASGVNFSNGASFSINMDQLEINEELGSGNYGTVKRILHKPTNVEMAMKVLQFRFPPQSRY
jgi:mitogen-activated protein kinase kinase